MGKLSSFLNNRTKKIISWTWDNILFLESLFLLAFIPLYPKLPLLDIQNTWVYIRVEDFIVFFVLLSWLTLLVRKKITLKTPLTIQILIFWIIGGIATIHGVLLIFPSLSFAFTNVAFLSLLRHIEYMSMFFIAFQGMKDKRMLPYVVSVLIITFLCVVFYGFGQKFLGFPAFLTMNEEFAKGVPITLSELSRVPSTFAGHYDLAAYLVLMIPILVSLAFGLKNWIIKIFLIGTAFLGVILLLMTVSRVSFFVLFFALGFLVLFQKRKLVLALLPVALIGGVLFLTLQSSLFDRFKSTISEAEVLVDADTGESIGHVRFEPKEYFKDKIVLLRRIENEEELTDAIADTDDDVIDSGSTIILPYKHIPGEVPILSAVNISTGENLPQGTGYTNLYLSPVIKRADTFFIELPPDVKSSPSAQAMVFQGNFIVKRASAYDLSFTTRFQGEWPRAIEAFKRNLLIGSGYGSVSLAVDNNYLRILGEVGLLGFISYFILFLSLGIYIRKIYPDIDSRLAKSFILGLSAGIIGLALNATLIDVFEASKIAFLLWLLFGISFATLVMYKKQEFSLLNEIKKSLTSSYAIIGYLFIFCLVLFSPMLNNYFVADDFTWLRWAADCKENCSPLAQFIGYFTNSDGFFYRPGTKIFFYIMYQLFWLNQIVYHLSSLVLHFMAVSLFFLVARKVFLNDKLAAFSSFLFLILSGALESVFWISSIGYLFNAVFSLSALLMFIYWEEKKKIYFLLSAIASVFLAMIFHEQGVVVPLFIFGYKIFKDGLLPSLKSLPRRADYLVLWIPVALYILLRLSAKSHWLSGDYSYDLLNLPFNFIGNIFGYASLGVLGPISFSFYETIRSFARENIPVFLVILLILTAILVFGYKLIRKQFSSQEKNIILFGSSFFFISLLPFLGLGNITSRYSYLASFGIVFILAVLFKKMYEYMKDSGREIAIGFSAVVIIVFVLFHLIQIQSTFLNWHEGGNKTKRFFISMESLYNNFWSREDAQFHFVDVPIRDGQAWIFPVGLPDAVWFAFRNDKARIFIHPDEKSAFESAGKSNIHPVFKFTGDGSVVEVQRPDSIPPNLIMP